MTNQTRTRITKKSIGRPMDFIGFDGKTYNGRIVDVKRRNWLAFTYYVRGVGEVTACWDLRKNRERIIEVF